MRFINWNIARHPPQSWQANSILKEVSSLNTDIACLTEARLTSAVTLDGYTAFSRGVAWSKQEPDECKVLLWSRMPLQKSGATKRLEELGGAAEVYTEIQGRIVRVIGLCIPYHMASPYGLVPKRKPWAQHLEFVKALKDHLDNIDHNIPTIVLGDFNRKIPRRGGPIAPYEALIDALSGFQVITMGEIDGVHRPTVDHIALGDDLFAKKILGLSEKDSRGKSRSDHFGLVADLGFR